ncbi:HK97-gp10 family putative phage morphogenesis protein [Rhodobacter sp. NSM]|uniref:HK97-gp10 family putative phage morphogenesis protein n=1 Tax=Rhodobacter sp. NSM TaxID=3457501 RepID=UPI003FD423A1
MRVRVEGLKELEAQLQKLSKAAGKAALRRAGISAMKPMAEIARSKAPVDEGDLRDSISVGAKAVDGGADIGKREFGAVMRAGGSVGEARAALRDARRSATASGNLSAVELYMGPTQPATKREAIKAIVNEFGSFKMDPQPYMRPAWDQDREALLERIKAEMWTEIQKAVVRARKRAARAAAKAAGG